MPIPLLCPCGRSLRIKDELAGRKIRCPDCRGVLEVPDPDAQSSEEEIPEVLPADDPPTEEERRSAIRAEKPQRDRPAWRPPPEDETSPPRLRPRSAERPLRRPPRKQPRVAFESGWFGNINAGVIGGILMMVIAVIWFVVGLAGGIIFFYPPVLFVIGFIAMVKGASGNS